MQKSDWLSQIQSFLAVIDHQSFTKAAGKHRTSPAALSRQIQWLEHRLKTTLIQRTTRKLQITEEGKYFYEKSKQLLGNLNEIIDFFQKQTHQLQGPLKITFPHAFGETRIIKLIQEFAVLHPKIEYILDFSNLNRDLITDEIDIAFRASPYEGAGYQSEKIISLQIGLYASQIYLKQHKPIKTPKDLSDHNCLLHEQIGYNNWEFKNNYKQIVTGNIKANHSFALIQFAKNHLGIVRTLENYVKQDKLLPVLKNYWPAPLDFYLVYKSGSSIPKRIQAFVEYVKSIEINNYLSI